MTSIAAGELDVKAQFQYCINSTDGHNTPNWHNDFIKWVGFKEDISTAENETSGHLVSNTTYTIKCRYSAKITAQHRIVALGETFEIIGKPKNVGFSNKVTLLTVRVIANA